MKTKNLSNSVWSVFDVLLYPTLFLFFTPYFIKHLGEEVYGIWVLVNTLIVFMQILNFGLGTNTLRNIAAALGRKDYKQIPLIINSNITISLVLSIISVGLGLVISAVSIQQDLFAFSDSVQSLAFISISLSGIIVSLKFMEQIFTNVLNAYEKIAMVARYNSLIRIINLLGALCLVHFNYSIITIFLFTIFSYSIALIVLYQIIQIQAGHFQIKFLFKWQIIRKELNISKWIWLQSIFVILAFQCDKFLVAYWIGVKQFSYYSIVCTIFNHLHMALMAVAPWALPQLSKRFSGGGLINQFYFSMRSLIHIICYLGILFFYFSYKFVFTIWLGTELVSNITLYLRLFMAFQLLFVFTIAPFFLLNAMGKSKLAAFNTFIYSSFSLTGLIIGYLLTNSAEGLILGSVISLVCSMLLQQLILSNTFSFNVFNETVGVISPMILLASFIILEHNSLPVRLILLSTSVLLFIYFYFYKYPVRFRFLKTENDIQTIILGSE